MEKIYCKALKALVGALLMFMGAGCMKFDVPDPSVDESKIPIDVWSISLNESSLTMTVGKTYTLAATVLPENASDKKVTYTVKGSAVTVSSSGVVTAMLAGSATVVATASNGMTATCVVTVTEGSKPESPNSTVTGGEWIDLGLSVKWLSCNLGASNPWEYGNYYVWGETSTYDSDASTTFGKTLAQLKNSGIVDAKGNLTSNYDVAQKFGKGRMPTKEEITEMIYKCTWTWTSRNGVKGSRVTGPNGNSIFLPAAGHYVSIGSSGTDVGLCGCYLSSTVNSNSHEINSLCFDRYNSFSYNGWRSYCYSVRPVMDE